MTIENATVYMSTLWDWAVLRGCFGNTRIQPTDIDGFVERNGYFLVFETKRAGVPVKQGQDITFEALRKTGLFTIFVVWGEPGKPERAKMYCHDNRSLEFECDMDALRHYTSEWFEAANAGRPYSPWQKVELSA